MTDVDLSCVYDLPAPLVVDLSVFGHAAPSRIGGLRISVVPPDSESGAFTPPALPGIPPDAPELVDRQWVTELPSLDDGFLELRRIGLVATANDSDVPAGRPGAGASVEDRIIDTLFVSIDSWFDRLRTWVEVATAQDLDTQAPLFPAWIEGAGLRAWHSSGDITDRKRMRFTSRNERPVDVRLWEALLERAGHGYPPLEHVLMRDARAALLRDQLRRAAIDAGAASELVLVQVADSALLGLKPPVRKAATPRQRTLGSLVAFVKTAEIDLPVSAEALDLLVKVRNAATHRVEQPSPLDARAVIDTSQRLVDRFNPLG